MSIRPHYQERKRLTKFQWCLIGVGRTLNNEPMVSHCIVPSADAMHRSSNKSSPTKCPRVVMVDPSAFTIPYDTHLCSGLAQCGAEVTLFTRPARSDDYFRNIAAQAAGAELPYTVCDHFYRYTESSALSRLKWLRSAAKAVEHVTCMRRFHQLMKRARPDVIHFQWAPFPAVDHLFVRRLRAIAPVVLTMHDSNGFLAPTSPLQLIGLRRLLHRCDQVIVHTQHGRQAVLDRFGLSPNRVVTVPHGILGHSGTYKRAVAARRDGVTVLLAFGSIKTYKGLDILIRALGIMPASIRDDLRLIIAGSPGTLGQSLKALASQCGVYDSIEWRFGFIPDEDVHSLIEGSNIVVFPYRAIDASGALMTVLPFGKAIVASNIGLFSELLEDGVTGTLVPPESPEHLANAIVKLLSDPACIQRQGANSAEMAHRVLGWERIARQTLGVYSSVVPVIEH